MRAEADRFLIQERSFDSGRGKDDGIRIRFRKHHMKLFKELLLNLKRLQVINRRHFAAHLQSGTHIVAVLGGSGRKISLLLMVKRRLRPSDMISSVFGFIEQRDGDVFRRHACTAKVAQCGVKSVPNLRGKSIEKQLTRDSQAKFSLASPQGRMSCQVWFAAYARI